MPEDPNHTAHHHIEHVHEDGSDHRGKPDCPGDEDGIEYPEPDTSDANRSGNHVPTPPPPADGEG